LQRPRSQRSPYREAQLLATTGRNHVRNVHRNLPGTTTEGYLLAPLSAIQRVPDDLVPPTTRLPKCTTHTRPRQLSQRDNQSTAHPTNARQRRHSNADSSPTRENGKTARQYLRAATLWTARMPREQHVRLETAIPLGPPNTTAFRRQGRRAPHADARLIAPNYTR
jgi:hypothetical protein